MNEASSKYVDQIAVEKLINEKLKLVQHRVPPGAVYGYDTVLDDFSALSPRPQEVIETRKGESIEISFPSAVRSGYEENDRVRCRYAESSRPAGSIVFVHGLYEDNVQIYGFLISMLREQGISVYSLTLPFHYERKPAQSLFSGEFFWSGDIDRSALAFEQALCDLYQLYHYARASSQGEVWIVGFSLGGGITLRLTDLAAVDGVFAINPVCNIGQLVWNSALFATVKSDLQASGLSLADVQARYRAFEPLNVEPGRTSHNNVVLARGLYDQINDPDNYDLLAARRGITHVLSYKAGHLNVLRVPRLATDISRFYFGGRGR